ncbi:hypothetical protein SLS53_007468 [Cytospora paraplurivora]|uniref:Uncharacterized protein n=1 Tax=Cytospora paraplurivora TaxID=2898453 RepID=A0AAN9U0J1_9PEZI
MITKSFSYSCMISMASSRIPIILALRGERDKLVSKPDTYSELLQLARKPTVYLHQLQRFADKEITFQFDWEGTDVDLDDSAFEFVHAKARLRIITPDQIPEFKVKRRSKSPDDSTLSQPPTKCVKIEDPLTRETRVEIDLTESDDAVPCSNNTITVDKRAPSAQDEIQQTDGEEQSLAENDVASQVNKRVPDEALQTGADDQTTAQNEGMDEKPQPNSVQPVAIPGLAADNFNVSTGSRTLSHSHRPGIYLLPPRAKDVPLLEPNHAVSVTLELQPGWKFGSVYPWTEIKSVDGIETAEWKVSINEHFETVSQSGSEEYFGHLSWETTVDSASKPIADKTPLFNPAVPNLNPQNSVVLDRDFILPRRDRLVDRYANYLYRVLCVALGVDENIVQDFLGYLETKFGENIRRLDDRFSIAVSFVPQTHIEEAARLSITPQPYATARIFMLFGAVDTTQKQGSWSTWAGRKLCIKNWKKITGVRPKVLKNHEEFRAIEWGMMWVSEEHLIKK